MTLRIRMQAFTSVVGMALLNAVAHAADPVIHLQWDGGGTPVANQDYTVDTTVTGTPDFPDVKLLTGRTDWRVWSTDTDNPGGVGDLGVLSCPAAANFAVKLVSDTGSFGARDVKAIRLVPTSSSNHGSLIGDPNGVPYSRISGQLLDELTVQADTSGNGGEVAVNIGDDATADMTIQKVSRLDIGQQASGTITIGELAGGGTTVGVFSGSMSIGVTSGENPIIRFFVMEGSLDVSEVGGDLFALFFPSAISATSTVAFGDITATMADMQFGTSVASQDFAGTMDFLAGIPSGTSVSIGSEFVESAMIDLNEQDIAGSLALAGGGSGSIVNGATVSGGVLYNGSGTDFSGSASFGGVTGSIYSFDTFSGTLEILGEVDSTGSITVTEFGTGGRLDFGPEWTSFPNVGGTVSLLNGVGAGAEVNMRGPLTSTGEVDLNGGDVVGTLALHSGGAGAVVNGGSIEGTVLLGVCCQVIPEAPGGPFTGTATFQGTSSSESELFLNLEAGGTVHLIGSHGGGSIVVADAMHADAALTIDGDSIGAINLGYIGFLSQTPVNGQIDIGGELTGPFSVAATFGEAVFGGSLCAANLNGSKPLPPNIYLQSVGAGATICGVQAGTCGTMADTPEEETAGEEKNRFISLVPGNDGTETAIAVNLDSLHHPATPANAPDFTDSEEQLRWVNAFRDGSNNPVFTCPDEGYGGEYKCATLGAEPEYYDWGAEIGATTVLHVTGLDIVPSSRYNVHLIADPCTVNWAAFSPGIIVETGLWGDVNGDGNLNVLDISDVVDTILETENAIPEVQALIRAPCLTPVGQWVNVLDLSRVNDALKVDAPYPFNVDSCSP